MELDRSVSPSSSVLSSPASQASPSLSFLNTTGQGAGRGGQPGTSTMRRILVGDIEHAEVSPPRPPVRGAKRPPLSVSVMSRSVHEQRTVDDRRDRRSRYIQNSLLASLATHGGTATAAVSAVSAISAVGSGNDDSDGTGIDATRSAGAGRHNAEKQRRHDRRRAERRRRRRAKRLKKNRETARKEMQREHDELYESHRYKSVPMQLWLGGEGEHAGAFFGKRKTTLRAKKGLHSNKPAWGAGVEAANAQSFSYNASQFSQSLPRLPRLHWRQAEREKAEKKSRDVLTGQHQWRKRVNSLLAKYHY